MFANSDIKVEKTKCVRWTIASFPERWLANILRRQTTYTSVIHVIFIQIIASDNHEYLLDKDIGLGGEGVWKKRGERDNALRNTVLHLSLTIATALLSDVVGPRWYKTARSINLTKDPCFSKELTFCKSDNCLPVLFVSVPFLEYQSNGYVNFLYDLLRQNAFVLHTIADLHVQGDFLGREIHILYSWTKCYVIQGTELLYGM